jgi:hypothetical protein
MKKLFIAGIIIIFTTIMACSNNKTTVFQEENYFVSKSYSLDPKTEGIEGTVEILLDKDMKNLKGLDFSEHHCDATDPYDKYKEAYLIVRTKDGKITDKIVLNDPLRILERNTDMVKNGQPVYFCSCYVDAGNPYLCGIYTDLYYIKNGKLLLLKAKDKKTGKKDTIWLRHCRRIEYKLVNSPSEKSKEIWTVWCDVYRDSGQLITYSKYYFNGNEWIVKERYEENKFWDSINDSFPDDSYYK